MTDSAPENMRNVTTDGLPIHTDRAAATDELGRAAFANALAMRIERVWEQEIAPAQTGSFLIHVHGPWGTGKTTILNLLAAALGELRTSDPWVIVHFNAWRYERLSSPWWWLISAVYSQGRDQVSRRHSMRALRLRVSERLWRIRVGRSPEAVVLLLVVAAMGVAWFTGLLPRLLTTPIDTMGEQAKAVSDVIALVVSVLAAGLTVSRIALTGTRNAPQTLLETARDPMREVTVHFSELVARLGQPLAVLVDDLDRCRSEYVVSLLDAIQNLFGATSAIYVVAADRRWLQRSYEVAYGDFTGTVEDIGRSVGYLFLDKTFQLSVKVPRLAPAAQEAYWHRLLMYGESSYKTELAAARRSAERRFANLRNEDEILALVARAGGGPLEQQALREAAVKRLAEANVAEGTEHALYRFTGLMDPNPRSMKRMVNMFGMQRDAAILGGVDIAMSALALWTILSIRWPTLAEYLEANPEMVGSVGQPPESPSLSHVPELMRRLLSDPDVVNVCLGGGVADELDPEVVRRCAELRGGPTQAMQIPGGVRGRDD